MYSGRVISVLLIIILGSLASCASKKVNPPVSSPSFSQAEAPSPVTNKASSSQKEKKLPTQTTEQNLKNFNQRQDKTRQANREQILIAPLEKKSKKKPQKIKISLDFENVDLKEFLNIIFIKILNKNYIVDPSVRGTVTAHIDGNFSEEEIINILNEILELQDVVVIKHEKFYKVLNISKLGKSSRDYSFLIVQPKYLELTNLSKIIRNFVSPKGLVIPERQTETLIIIDSPKNLKKISKIIKVLDKNILQGFYIESYSPKVIEAEILGEYLTKIFRSPIFKSSLAQNYVDFIPIKEINCLLIIAKNQNMLETVKNWLEQLDSGETTEEQVFVYYVENGDAEEIGQILQETFTGIKKSKRETIVKAKTKSNIIPSNEIKIISDKTNNLLIIKASKEDYQLIIDLLKKIDIVPRQVVIEVLIAEIALNKDLEFGVEWFFKTKFKTDGRWYTGNLVLGKYGAVPAKMGEVSGISYSIFRGDELRGLIKALDSISKVHILSNPVILASDNKEAKIQIGQEIPIITQKVANTASSNLNVTQSITYRDTGIILEVKPHINSSGLVKLDITQEVSEASGTIQGIDSPVISTRRMQTSLVVQNGHTVVLGGLIREKRDENESGVPILKDVPVLGNFFKWRTDSRNRTELLVAITPRVVRNMEEAEEVMRKFREKIEDLKLRLSKGLHSEEENERLSF